MFKKMGKIILLIIVFALVSTSCSNYQRLLKSTDYNLKYTEGIKYYEKEDYYRAKTLFEELIPILRGTIKSEKIYYYYAYCNFNLGDQVLAGYYFKNFARTYPNSKHIEEAEYMSAYCQFLNSPEPELDQTYTHKALQEFQYFINKYPNSKYIPDCNKYVDRLRKKLEDKAFISSKLYYNLGDYKAAVVVLDNTLNDFPDTDYREELLYLSVKANYKLAEGSVYRKQKERYQNTIDAYYTFVDEYPESEYTKDVKKMYKDSINRIKK